MAVKFGPELVTYPDGDPIINAPIYVRKRGSFELAQLWSDEMESSFGENPAMTDLAGNLVFFVDPGYYDLVHQGNEFPITVGTEGGGEATSYTHVQSVAVMNWLIVHNLGFKPGGVRVVQSTGEEIIGSVSYPDINTVAISFGAATAGVAHLS